MYRVLLACALLLGCSTGYVSAQTDCNFTIKGTVVEIHTFEPLYPVLVHVEELKANYETDENGRFTVDSLCAGKYTLHFHAPGYEHYQEEVVVQQSSEYRFKLSHLTHILTEVEISQERNPTLLQAKEKMDRDAIAANSGKTLGDMLQSVNGVTTLTNGGSIAKPVIHGLHSNRIVMLNNGVRQEDQQWGSEHAPNIDPFLANTITVLKGAASVRYGTDALGGVVLVEPAPLPIKAGWAGEANLAGFSNNRMGVGSVMLEHCLPKVPAISFRMQGTYKKGGNYRIPGYWADNTGVEENNFSAALGWRKLHHGAEVFYSRFNTDLGIYTGSHTGNEKDLNAAIRSDTPLVPASFAYAIARPKQHVVHDLVKTRLYTDTRLGMWNLIYSYQHNFRQEYDIVRKEDGKAQLNLTLATQTLNLNLDHKAIGNVKGQAGIDVIYQDNSFKDGDRLFIPLYTSVGGAAYIIERYKWGKWNTEAGLRYDNRWYEVLNYEGSNQHLVKYQYNYNSVSGTIGANRQYGEKWNIGLTLANAWRAPQANELFSAGLHHGAARIELGNKDLLPERSYNLNGEVKYTGGRLSAELSVYSQYISNYIYLEPGADVLTIRGYFKTFNYRQTNASLTGSDLSANYNIGKYFNTTFKASVIRARDVDKKDWLILMPADRLSLGLKYTRSISPVFRDCFAGVNARYVFQQTRIPSNFDQIDYPRPPESYLLPEVEAGTRLAWNKQSVYVSLSVTNILNTRYRDYLDAFRYFIDQPGRNIVLRVRVPFTIHQSKNQ